MSPMMNEELFPWEEPADEESAMSAIAPSPAAEAPARERERETPRDARAETDRTGADDVDPVRERTVVPREYYSISEVCDLVGLKPHVLRYWETQFGPLNPSKNRSGNRVYQKKEIRLIMLVKHLLYEEKYTVEGARAKLEQLRRGGRLRESTGRALTTDSVTMVRREMEHLLQILAPDAAS
jgi:DNA-binding transcriptional MerR regulator